MGYSCTAKAMYTLDMIGQEIGGESQNVMPDGGFYEIGRENADGSITGTVWRKLNDSEKAQWAHLDNLDTRVVKRGSFKILPSGKISRFPGLDGSLKAYGC